MAINLLPWREKKLKRESLFFISGILFCLLCACAITYFVRAAMVKQNQQFSNANLHLLKIVSSIELPSEYPKLKKNYAVLYQKLETLIEVKKQSTKILFILSLIMSSLPNNCYLESLGYENQNFKISGFSPSLNLLYQFINRLEKKGLSIRMGRLNHNSGKDNEKRHFLLQAKF